ncbi:hypothetical protein O181_088423 [Austropuccinia psidii MF-1]|uniref:Retrotransposon gag domain-containing protein n=1 Tax=Austropuccinia psidii MF-1 TaxID=1389203 RepID=A0A9Q3IRG6_9BASI|nr:hypothetical protein [Austropuccinia psidii MF-1]
MERAPVTRTIFKGPGGDGEEEDKNPVKEEESDGTEGAPALVGASQGTGGPTLAQSDQPVSHQSEPSLLAIMQKMTQIMANIQAAPSYESSRPPAFKTTSMKAPQYFDGTQTFKQTSLKTERRFFVPLHFSLAGLKKWIETYLSNLTNQDPRYLLNSRKLFEYQLFTLFGDPNEVRKAEAELDFIGMKEGGHVSLYIVDFRNLVSQIGDWGERALINHFRMGLPSSILDKLASHPSRIDSIQDLMDITLELDTRFHEKQKREESSSREEA